MRYFKKVKQFINLYNTIIKRFDNDLTDNDTTVFSRLMKIHDLHTDSPILILNKSINKIRNNANDAFIRWNRRGSDIALNKYIEDSIKYILECPKLSEKLNAYNNLFRDHKAGFYHDSDKKMIDILTNEQLMRLIFAITLKE
jgi:hypothetical protein